MANQVVYQIAEEDLDYCFQKIIDGMPIVKHIKSVKDEFKGLSVSVGKGGNMQIKNFSSLRCRGDVVLKRNHPVTKLPVTLPWATEAVGSGPQSVSHFTLKSDDNIKEINGSFKMDGEWQALETLASVRENSSGMFMISDGLEIKEKGVPTVQVKITSDFNFDLEGEVDFTDASSTHWETTKTGGRKNYYTFQMAANRRIQRIAGWYMENSNETMLTTLTLDGKDVDPWNFKITDEGKIVEDE